MLISCFYSSAPPIRRKQTLQPLYPGPFFENEIGVVRIAGYEILMIRLTWTDFAAIASRHQIADRQPQLHMASEVAASIATAAAKR
jgi:hypothetical protein